MKKFASLLLALCLTLCCSAALAAGNLEVIQETYITVKCGGSIYGYLYAEITNTGDSNAELGSSVVEVLSESGDVTGTDTIYYSYPTILAPGEKGYIVKNLYTADGTQLSDISGHSLSIFGKTSSMETETRLDASAVVEAYESWSGTSYRVVVTITNNTDETVYDAQLAAGVYDQNGTLLFAADGTLYDVGIPAGITLEYRMDVDYDIIDYWNANGIQPVSAEAICYIEAEY